MKKSAKLSQELQKLNQTLDGLSLNKSRFFIYNANPLKFALYNFIAGIFHSLGSLFGTAVIAVLVIYFVSQIDLVNPVVNWFNQVMTRLDWNAIIPSVNLDENLLQQVQP